VQFGISDQLDRRGYEVEDPKTAPLRDWNRLARENAENAIVASMFEAAALSSESIDKFATWLLVGSAAIASFFVANADRLIPLLGGSGFLMSGGLLCASCAFGLVSKMYAVRCKVAGDVGHSVRATFAGHLHTYKNEAGEIQKNAKAWGITLETGIRIERVLEEFYRPMPKVIAWLARRQLERDAGDPQIGQLYRFRALLKQSTFALLQSFVFLGFLISALVCSAWQP